MEFFLGRLKKPMGQNERLAFAEKTQYPDPGSRFQLIDFAFKMLEFFFIPTIKNAIFKGRSFCLSPPSLEKRRRRGQAGYRRGAEMSSL